MNIAVAREVIVSSIVCVSQALATWLGMTGSWNAPLFFGEFGANNDPNPDNQDFQVMLRSGATPILDPRQCCLLSHAR